MRLILSSLLSSLLLSLSLPIVAAVQSETVFFLQPDGRQFLIERSIHSESATHRFHLDKRISLEDIRHISPARFEWDDSNEEFNSLSFDAGGFTVIYPDQFDDSELKQDKDGVLHYKSWDGTRDANGRYGYWYAPGQFDQFSYTWIVPDNIELLRYRANRQGSWTRRNNAISFYVEQANNLTFEMSYRVKPLASTKPAKVIERTAPATADKQQACQAPPPQNNRTSYPPPPTTKRRLPPTRESSFARSDKDLDKVSDDLDLCPDTPQGARVDRTGCPLDTDHDGVPDGVDACIATPDETAVGSDGCIIE